nr:MAG TPA: hypothetical protein [Caudoviricetes sp.]
MELLPLLMTFDLLFVHHKYHLLKKHALFL